MDIRLTEKAAPGVGPLRLRRRRRVRRSAVGLTVVAIVVAAVLGQQSRNGYDPLVDGNFDNLGPGRAVSTQDQVPTLTLPGGRPQPQFRYLYQSTPFSVVESVHSAGGWGVTVQSVDVAPVPPFLSPVRSAGPVEWSPDAAGRGPFRPLPASLPGGGDLSLKVPLRWPSCKATGYVGPGSLTVTHALVKYRFLGEEHTVQFQLGIALQFLGSDQCPR